MKIKPLALFLLIALSSPSFAAKRLTVPTKAPSNANAVFHYRVPKNYDATRRELYRVLVFFGGRNTSGEKEAKNHIGWGDWCDKHDVFLVCPGFKNDNYWEPQAWSGRALFQALAQLKKEYRICTTKILYYGYSAGSQASNLFPAWQPDRCRAWVSHACGYYHEPSARLRGVPGLVTCGDADQARYAITRNFVEQSRKKGVDIIWKSLPNHPHDVPPDSLKLARAFLAHYDAAHRGDLSGTPARGERMRAAFIGDDQDRIFYPASSAQAKNILPEDRVPLPNLAIAEAWGKAAP